MTATPGLDAAGPGRRLRARCCSSPRTRASSARRTAAGPGWSPASCPRRSPGCASWAPRRSTAWVGPHVCGALLRGARADAGRGRRRRARPRCAETSWGTPSVDLGAGVRAQLEALGVGVHDVSRCTRESDDLYSYRRDGAGAGRQAGLVRLRGHADEPPRRDRGRAGPGPRADRRGLRRRRPRPRRGPARRGDQVLPGLRRPDPGRARGHRRRGEPAPGGRGQGGRVRRPRPAPGTSSAASRATRRPPWRRTPTWSSRSTGASWCGRCRRARTSGRTPSTCCSRSRLDPPGATGRSGADPADLAELAAARSTRPGMLTLRGLMAVAPLGEDPATAFARLAEIRPEFLGHAPRRRPGSPRG